MRTSILRDGLACIAWPMRAISWSISRCFSFSVRIASFAERISSAIAPNTARQSAIGRASPFSPTERRLGGEALGEFLARGFGGDLVVDRGALVLQGLPALLKFRRGRRTLGARRTRIDRPDGDARGRLALDPQRRRIETGRKSRAISVVSPCGRSTLTVRVTVAPSG